MNSFLVFKKLDTRQRQDVLACFGLFLFLESTVLALSVGSLVPFYVTASAGLFLAALSFWRRSRCSWFGCCFLPLSDLALYVGILLGSFLVLPGSIGMVTISHLIQRDDVILFLVASGTVSISVVFPSIGDNYILRKLPKKEHPRKLEYLKKVPFGLWRCVSAFVSLLFLSIAGLLFIAVGNSFVISAGVMLYCGVITYWCFAYLYGYRSHIMRVFGRTLFITVFVSLLLQTQYASYIPSILIKYLAYGWSAAFLGVAGMIWSGTDKELLVPAQRVCHSLYLVTLGFCHLVVYSYWIFPIISQRMTISTNNMSMLSLH